MRVGVTGHRDLGGAAEFVAAVVRVRFAATSGLVVVTCLAAGADQMAASIALELGGGLEVVIPCDDYEATFSGGPALAAFEALVVAAGHVERLAFDHPCEDAFMAGGRRVVDRSDRLLAVWDGAPSQGLGGTADVVAYARRRGVPVEVVWPAGVTR